jgi:hypothetical protein
MMRHLSYSNVLATVALFIAIGGTSYAALRIPRNSVGHAQLRNNAVTSLKVRNGTLRARDFKAGDLPRGATGPKGSTGAKGSTGSRGSAGEAGATGPAGPTATAVAATNPVNPPDGPDATLTSTGITTKSSGPLLITALGSVHSACASTPCTADVGVYVDGQPVANTGIHIDDTGDATFNEIGRTATLPTGAHTVSIAVKRTGSALPAVTFSGAGLSVIAATG